MLDDARSNLQRALRDLEEGLRVLLGLGPAQLEIVDELLETGDAAARRRADAGAGERSRAGLDPPRKRRHRVRRSRRSTTLVLVK
jgi:hypothetical protein